MSPAPVPIPPLPRPTNRSDADSDATNARPPLPEICCSDTALASGHPSQPAVLINPSPFADALIRLIHRTSPLADGVGAGAGVGAGSVAGPGDGAGVGAGAA